MDTTFISIHDLSLDARLLYVSASIEDILGYHPNEVVGRSCWEYFHPDEIPFAQAIHGRSIQLDKAAVLHYCQIKSREGRWYQRLQEGKEQSKYILLAFRGAQAMETDMDVERAKDAPVIRQLFSSSPRDPRYHMLQYISAKFSKKIQPQPHEPRAALFLNRFSRTLTIMYATNGLADILGISNDQLTGKSFYYCIQENCLREAVKCLESAKANDSIAYLRFWFRDPRQDEPRTDRDEHMSDDQSSGDDDDGGVHLAELIDHDGNENAITTGSSNSMRSSVERDAQSAHPPNHNSRSSSGNSIANDAIFDQPEGGQQSRTSSISTPDEPRASRQPWSPGPIQVELEAVVSCTSDGLVVVLRRARPFVPHVAAPTTETPTHPYTNGLFASPWANDPILPDMDRRSNPLPDSVQATQFPINPTAQQANTAATHGPASEDFMNSIREVAVFAWSLTGINGSLAQYSRGTPSGESQPESLPVWDPYGTATPEKERQTGSTDHAHHCNHHNVSQYSAQPNGNVVASDGRQLYSYATGLPNINPYRPWEAANQGAYGQINQGMGNGLRQMSGQGDGPSTLQETGHNKTTQAHGYYGSSLAPRTGTYEAHLKSKVSPMATKHGEAHSYYNDSADGQSQMRYQQPPPNYGQNYNAGPPPQAPMTGSGDGKQTFEQAFKLERPRYNDLWAGILLILTFLGFVAVSGISLQGYANNKSFSGGGIYNAGNQFSLNTNTIVLFVFVLCVALVFSWAYFTLASIFAKNFIWITGILHIVFGIGTAVYYFVKHYYSAAVVFAVFSIFSIICFVSWIPRIPFSVVILQQTMYVAKSFGHVFLVSAIGGLCSVAFGAWFSVTLVSIYVKYEPSSGGSNPACTAGSGSSGAGGCSTAKVVGLLVFVTFAGYWITEWIKNTMHSIVAGVYGSWFFCAGKPGGMPKGATRGAARRALTYSFGSISLGSLVVALINMIRQVVSVAQSQEAQNGNIVGTILFCVLGCIIGLINWAVQYVCMHQALARDRLLTFNRRFINRYAFSHIALYGKAYIPAAKDTWTMMKNRGIDALINDCLISPVLTMGATFVAYLCAFLAYLYLQFTSPAYNDGGTFTPVIMAFSFLIGLQVCQIFMTPIGSGVDTVFVSMAWDPDILMKDHPDFYNRVINVYPRVQEMIHA
ncbi:MAG: hypothetical protein Q9217_005534 [Psora testacea]